MPYEVYCFDMVWKCVAVHSIEGPYHHLDATGFVTYFHALYYG